MADRLARSAMVLSVWSVPCERQFETRRRGPVRSRRPMALIVEFSAGSTRVRQAAAHVCRPVKPVVKPAKMEVAGD